MRKLFFLMLGAFFLLSLSEANAQKERFHSLFIYNFCKYVKWPEGQQSDDFVIGVLGSENMVKTLKAAAGNKKVNGKPIAVKHFKNPAEVAGCHILYVANSSSHQISKVLDSTTDESVLIVSDKPGFAKKGAAINFIEKQGKIKFELNQEVAESRGLKISGSLASLAILV